MILHRTFGARLARFRHQEQNTSMCMCGTKKLTKHLLGIIGALSVGTATYGIAMENAPATPEPIETTQMNGELARLAETGVPEAMTRLGKMYRNGSRVHQDASAARYWFNKAAQLDDPEAWSELGGMLLTAEGGDPDPVAAARWLRMAAIQGIGPAQYR